MLKTVVLKQKKEKEHLLSLNYVPRNKSLQAKKWFDSDLIKVVVGPRRAGKSMFSLMMLKEKPFMYFNFDDETLFLEKSLNYDDLLKELHVIYGKTKYILFDEIQNLPRWELFVNRLHRHGYNLTLTGSNARLLSRELSTALTGRHIPIEIMPFNFKEFLRAKNFEINFEYQSLPDEKAKLLQLVEEYFLRGGFPEIVVKNFDAKEYLSILFDSLLFKDVVKRHKIRFSNQIDNLSSFLINNVGNLYSLRRLANGLSFKSDITTERYLSYLEEAYLLFPLFCYSYKAGERIKMQKKIYIIDNGFVLAKAVPFSQDFGRLIENVVFTELVKRGFKPNQNIFYYKTRNTKEIDFVLKKGLKIEYLIQVFYQINKEREKKEINALLEASQELSCDKLLVITWDEEKEEKIKNKLVKFIPLWQWLLNEEQFLNLLRP